MLHSDFVSSSSVNTVTVLSCQTSQIVQLSGNVSVKKSLINEMFFHKCPANLTLLYLHPSPPQSPCCCPTPFLFLPDYEMLKLNVGDRQ